MAKEALSGLKVLEYGEFISAPYCGKLLADLGAEVIKIEPPGSGDPARRWGPFPQNLPHPEKSGLFLYLNTNKLGITLDIGSAAGIKIFRALAGQADVLVENTPPHALAWLGLDYESLHRINPRLVVTSITPFGQTGPYHDYKGCDLTAFHASGEAYINPTEGVNEVEKEPPLKVPAHGGDFLSGLDGAIGTMSAVIAQHSTGQGQHVDISQQEALAHMTCHEFGQYNYGGAVYYREKSKRDVMRSGSMFFPTRDGYIIMSMFGDAFWPRCLEMMGNPDWAKGDEYKDPASRRRNSAIIMEKTSEWTRQHTNAEINEAVNVRRIPSSPVQTVKEAIDSELLKVREFFVDIDHSEAGKFKYPGAPYKLSGTPWRIKTPAPRLGEHNEEVYCQKLGYARQDLVRMRQAGII